MPRRTLLTTVLVYLSAAYVVRTAYAFPSSTGSMVNDWASILLSSEERDLESLCQQIEGETTVEIFVITTTDLEGYDLDRYAYLIFNQWGIGKPDVNNGLLLAVHYQELNATHFAYDFRIEVGRGMEATVTDAEAGQIGRLNVTRWFDVGYYYEGLREGILTLYREFEGDPRVRADPPPFELHRWAYENPLLTGFGIGLPMALTVQSLRYLRYRGAWIVPSAVLLGLTIFAVWLDSTPPFVVLLYALGVAFGGHVAIGSVRRTRGGGGRSQGGGWRS